MHYRLLGDLEISQGDQLLDLPSGPTLVLLTTLLINANRQISKTALIRAAWGDAQVGEAQLPKRIGMVRDLLARLGRRDDLRTHPGFGYEMHIAEDDIDTLSFQRFVRQAGEAASRHRTEIEIDYLRRALRMWRGPRLLSNLPRETFRHDAMAFEQRHKRAAAKLFDLEFARGNHETVLDELITIAGYYASDRRLCEQLLIAQHRCGHPADVSAAYERYRAAMADEFGGEPDPLLRKLHFAIARGDSATVSAVESALANRSGAVPSRITAVPRQLPPAVELIGRDDLLAEVTWLLGRESDRSAPVVVICGPAGVGKTALAVQAAQLLRDRYRDGQLFMQLNGTDEGRLDTSEILARFMRALGATSVPDTKAERLAEYRTLVANRRVLIVLDDAVQRDEISELIPANPACAVLVTSQRRMPEIVDAHNVAPLEPLSQADAIMLFLQVVSRGGVTVTDDLTAVSKIITLCGGLPLALRIAGALRVHGHPRPTSELADRLARGGLEAFEFGQLSVARSIAAGYERLDPTTQRLFLDLSLLPLKGFRLWAAAAVLDGSDGDAASALSQLAATYLIEWVTSEQHYRFYRLTKEYSRQRALGERETDHQAVLFRTYRALLTLARRADAGLRDNDRQVARCAVEDWDAPTAVLAEVDASPISWFERERANIRAAVELCASLGLTGLCWDLAVSSREFYAIGGYVDDWHSTHTTALDACRRAGERRAEQLVSASLKKLTERSTRPPLYSPT